MNGLPPILTAEEIVKRIAAERAFIDDRRRSVFAEPAAAIVRQCGKQFRAAGGKGDRRRNPLPCSDPGLTWGLAGLAVRWQRADWRLRPTLTPMSNFGGGCHHCRSAIPAPGADVGDTGEPLDFGRIKSVIKNKFDRWGRGIGSERSGGGKKFSSFNAVRLTVSCWPAGSRLRKPAPYRMTKGIVVRGHFVGARCALLESLIA
jgi:hypothetical protein